MTKDEALKLALSTLANARDWIGNDPEGRWNEDEMYDELCNMVKFVSKALAEQPAQRTWVGLTHEDTYEATGTASTDLLDLAKLWSDNKVHVYQFDNEARKIIEAVLRRASAKLREKNA